MNFEKIKKRDERLSNSSKKSATEKTMILKLKMNEERIIRILQDKKNDNPFFPILSHYLFDKDLGIEGERIFCPKTLNENNKCPICDHQWDIWNTYGKPYKDLEESKKPKYYALAKKALRRLDYAFNIFLYKLTNEEKLNKDDLGNRIVIVSKNHYDKLMEQMSPATHKENYNPEVDEEGYGDITDIKTGRNIVFSKIPSQFKSGKLEFNIYNKPSSFLEKSPKKLEYIMNNFLQLEELFVEGKLGKILSTKEIDKVFKKFLEQCNFSVKGYFVIDKKAKVTKVENNEIEDNELDDLEEDIEIYEEVKAKPTKNDDLEEEELNIDEMENDLEDEDEIEEKPKAAKKKKAKKETKNEDDVIDDIMSEMNLDDLE